MKKAEQIAALFWIAMAGAVCLGSLKLRLGTPSEPGSGFLPFWTGALLGGLALVHLVNVTVRKGEGGEGDAPAAKMNRKRAWAVVASLLAYAVLLSYCGYLVTTFFLMIVLFSLYERRKWWILLGATALLVGCSYLVFHNWLLVQFPRGFLG